MQDLTEIIGLRDRDLRREGLFVAEGRLLVERTLASGLTVTGICADAAAAAEAEALAASSGGTVSVHVCESAELDRIAGFPFHRGLFAVARRPVLRSPFMDGSPGTFPSQARAASSRILVLPAITDPGNLGTLLRSALAFGYGEVWLGNESCDPFNRKALRASMGAALSLDLRMAESADLGTLRGGEMKILAAAMEEGAIVAGNYACKGHALVLGNEFNGIGEAWRRECDEAILIPVGAEVDSLNVAIAGSILMWELTRQAPSRP